jgi:putative ABC transport system ATP-binding protein
MISCLTRADGTPNGASIIHAPMDARSTSIVVGEGLARTYRLGSTRVQALQGVDICVRPGDFVVVQGPSGSGKTTLINLLGLLDHPDSGRVLLDGRPVTTLHDDELADLRRDRIGFVFQSFSLIPVLTAAENVAYPMMLKGLARAEIRRRTGRLLERVGLAARAGSRPDRLSGGERQRVAIARALANGPDLILADEPTANLDSSGAESMLDLMRELNGERQVAFVIATHDPRVVARARRTVTLRDGQFVTSP